MSYTMLLSFKRGIWKLEYSKEWRRKVKWLSEKNMFSSSYIFIADYNYEYRDVKMPIKNQENFI